MDEIGWILLVIVVACVIALVLIAKKRKELEEEIYEEPEEERIAPRPEPVKKDTPKEAPKETGPRQVTIYGYHAVGRMRLCPLCDGENALTATQCHICGQQLN